MKDRDIRAMIEEAGLTMVSLSSKGKHHKAVVRGANGKQTAVSFPKTPSDHRALLNKRAQLRSLSKQYKE